MRYRLCNHRHSDLVLPHTLANRRRKRQKEKTMFTLILNYPMVVELAIIGVVFLILYALVADDKRRKEKQRAKNKAIANRFVDQMLGTRYPASMSKRECAELNKSRWN